MSSANTFQRPERNGREHVRTIDPELLFQELRSNRPIVVVDVRKHSDFIGPEGHIQGAISIPLLQLLARRAELIGHKSDRIVVVSRSGARARLASLELEFAGFHEVSCLEGGLTRWLAIGLPVEHSPGA